jgi:hypothetical protein
VRSKASAVVPNASPGKAWAMGCYSCDCCGKLSLVWLEDDPKNVPENDYGVQRFIESTESDLTWFPRSAVGKTYDDVPHRIAATASEAHVCLEVGSLRAAALLARSVVEATAKEKGFESGSLAAKVDALCEADLVRPQIKAAAHEIRYLGNEMAHGDFIAPVSTEDAELILELMDEVLEEVFQSPARVARIAAKRLARQRSGPE